MKHGPIVLLRHDPRARPLHPLGAHALAVLCVIAASVGSAIVLMVLDFGLGATGFVGMGEDRPTWLRRVDEVAVHLLVMWVAFLYQLIIFFPLFLLALWRGVGGALTGALISAGIFGAWGLTLVDPTWPGVLLGLFYGGVYGLAFHPLATWCLKRPVTRKT